MPKVIDADYSVVRPTRPKTPWVGPGDIEELFRVVGGLACLAFAFYCIHLFLAGL
jgi:hypothetical protein